MNRWQGLRNYYGTWILIILLILLAGCQTTRETQLTLALQPDMPTIVQFPLIASSQVYTFNTSPLAPTLLTIEPLTPNLPYSAEVHNALGELVTALSGATVQSVALMLSPANSGYQLTLSNSPLPQQGALSVKVGSSSPTGITTDKSSLAQNIAIISPRRAGCQAISAGQQSSVFRNPYAASEIVGLLRSGQQIDTSGNLWQGWIEVVQGTNQGWMPSGTVRLIGECSTLNTALAPPQQELRFERDGWNSLSDSLSATNPTDLITLEINNLLPLSAENYREFTLNLLCTGNDADILNLRWGAPQQPVLRCGQSTTAPFTTAYPSRQIALSLVSSNIDTVVNYTVTVMKP